jgi:hypothetical protein
MLSQSEQRLAERAFGTGKGKSQTLSTYIIKTIKGLISLLY